MKKILLLLVLIFIGTSNTFGMLLPQSEYCRYGFGDEFCTKNYVYLGDFKSEIIIRKYDWNEYLSRDEFGMGFHSPNHINFVNMKYSSKEKYDGKYLYISKFYESKYGNHVFYTVSPKIDTSEYSFTDKEIKEGKQKLYKKFKNIVGLYIDNKRIGEYVLDGKVDYKNIEEFLVKNKIMAFDYDDNYPFGKTDYILKKRTLGLLDNFVRKIELKKYNKDKLLKKIDKVYDKYKNKEGIKNRFFAEVLLYLHTEILIKKLKQDKKLLKINYSF